MCQKTAHWRSKLEEDKIESCLERLRNLERTMRNQNSGADIHKVGNIRNQITGLISVLEDRGQPYMDVETILKILKNCEEAVVEHFKLKYGVEPKN